MMNGENSVLYARLGQQWSNGWESGLVTDGLPVRILEQEGLADVSLSNTNTKFAPWVQVPCAVSASAPGAKLLISQCV